MMCLIFCALRMVQNYNFHYLVAAASAVGVRHEYKMPVEKVINDDFVSCLLALEAVNKTSGNSAVNKRIKELLEMSEVDLGVKWVDGIFIRKGAEELDDKLINLPLKWLRSNNYENVLLPFEKGLDHLLRSNSNPDLLYDVITDMYESLEALSHIVTGRSEDLCANREMFLSKIKSSKEYKPILKEYISYANNFRHAVKEGKLRPKISEAECESFVYLTGLFMRLVIESEKV